MSKFTLIAATTALLIVGGGSNALAQQVCTGPTQGNASAGTTQYQGYSNKLAKKQDAPGNSTVMISTTTWVLRCITNNPDGSQTLSFPVQYTTTEQNYTDGPGNSPFDKKNPFAPPTCVEAATASIPCPF